MGIPKKTAVLASGRGSNFQAVLRALSEGRITGTEITVLITDRPGTGAEELAKESGIPVKVTDYKSFPDRSSFDAAVDLALGEAAPDLILTLGYMRLIHPETVKKYKYKIINIHPSLLPAFPGMHSQRQAFEYGVRVTGATVHFMDEGVDTGPVILQAPVEITADMDLAAVEKAVLAKEHSLICEAVQLFCDDRIRVEGRKTVIH